MAVELTELPDAEVAANRERWLTALESGHYDQGTGVLRTDEGAFCCLGVAEDVRDPAWDDTCTLTDRRIVFVDATGARIFHQDYSSAQFELGVDGARTGTVLTADGARWLGVRDLDPSVVAWDHDDDGWVQCTLTTLNDDWRLSFSQIAAVIRDQPAGWNGRYNAAQREADRRQQENVPRPAYARLGRDA